MSNLCFEPLIKALSDHVVNSEISKIRTSLSEETKDAVKGKPVIGEKRAWTKEMSGNGVKQLMNKCKTVEESVEKLKKNVGVNDKRGVLFLDASILTKMTEHLYSVPGRIAELAKDEESTSFNEERKKLFNDFKVVIDNEFRKSLELMKNCLITFLEKDETKQRVAILSDDIRDERQNLNKLIQLISEVLKEDLKRKITMLDALRRERQEVVAINKSLTEQKHVAHQSRLEAEKKVAEVRESLAKIIDQQDEINKMMNSITNERQEVEKALEANRNELSNSISHRNGLMKSLEENRAELDKTLQNDSLLQQLCVNFKTLSIELQKLNKLNDLRTMYKDSTNKFALCQSQCSQIKEDIENRCSRIEATTKNLHELQNDSSVKLNALQRLIEQKNSSVLELSKESDKLKSDMLQLLEDIQTIEKQNLIDEINESRALAVPNSPKKNKIDNSVPVLPMVQKKNLSQGYAHDGNETVMTSDDDDEDAFFETKTPLISQVTLDNNKKNSYQENVLTQDLNETVMTSDDDDDDLFLDDPKSQPIHQNAPLAKKSIIELNDSLMDTEGEDESFNVSMLIPRRKSKEHLPRKASVNTRGYTKYFDLDESSVNFNSANFITSTPVSKKETKRKPSVKKPPVVKKPPMAKKQPKKPAKKRN